MKKVVIIQKSFENYRKPVFDRIARKYSLLLLYGRTGSGLDEIPAYALQVNQFKYGPNPTNVYLVCQKQIRKFKPNVIIHEFTPSIISIHWTFLLSKLSKIRFVVWGHGYNRKKGFVPQRSLSDWIRLKYLNNASNILLYDEASRRYLSKYADMSKAQVAPNTLDTDLLISIRERFETQGKASIKKTLGITHGKNLVFVGRLMASKRPGDLLILANLLECIDDLAIHVIGDGDQKTTMKQQLIENEIDNVFMHGEIKDDEEVGRYLYVSDLTVIPGALGLAINHSFCFDTPIVTLKQGALGPYHGPEINYVKNDKTGFLVDDLDTMVKKIREYFENPVLQQKMKTQIRQCIAEECGIDNMIQGFGKCIDETA